MGSIGDDHGETGRDEVDGNPMLHLIIASEAQHGHGSLETSPITHLGQ